MSDLPADTGATSRAAVEARPLDDWLLAPTWSGCLAAAAALRPEACAYRWLASPQAAPVDLSYGEIAAGADMAARAFSTLGERPVVASLLPALPATLPLAFGAMAAGVYMPVNPMLNSEAIVGMLVSARASALLLPVGQPEPEGVLTALPDLVILRIDESALATRHLSPLSGLPTTLRRTPEAEDICAYFHTGGTTGAPKIARLRQRNLAYMAWLAGFGGGMRRSDVVPCGMPLFHVGGLVFGGLAPLAAGAIIVQLGTGGYRDPDMRAAFAEIANREGATILFAPPTIAVDVMASTPRNAFRTARHWVSSAAPLPVATHKAFTAHTGLPVKEAWGLTEATLVVTFAPSGAESRPGSVGPALPYCRVAVVDPHSHAPLPAGETGLILVRSPGLFAGYLGNEASGLKTGPDGEIWLDTGDMGRLDDNGWLSVTGRAKDMILRGGHNIDPADIEAAYLAQPGVTAAIAVGRPDARVGEQPMVFLTRRADDPADRLLRDTANALIADPVARPKNLHVLAEMPLTVVGKPDRPALRRMAAELAVREAVQDATAVTACPGPGGSIAINLKPMTERDSAVVQHLGLTLAQSTACTETP
ncbi:MAG: AMP-binding protein [Pararhodobacter sp.]|nr:AMP-binding protein [Pararhodobacter sp.]